MNCLLTRPLTHRQRDARLDALMDEADAAMVPFGAKSDTLRAAARCIAERRA